MTAINSLSLFLHFGGMTLATVAIRLREDYCDRVVNTYAWWTKMMFQVQPRR